MRAIINGKWTYEVPEGSREGDEVELPGKNGGKWKGKISSIGSDFEGEAGEVLKNLSLEREKELEKAECPF
jgi:hypothetical protein